MMRCMVKKGLLVGGLGAAILFGLFGTRAWHYTRYAANKVRENARAAMPFDADVDAARQQVLSLKPAIDRGIETLAKLEQSIQDVQGQITAMSSQKDNASKEIERLYASLDSDGVQRVSTNDTRTRRARIELGRQIDLARRAKYVLEVKQSELDHRQVQWQKLHDTLLEMKAKREALLSKIEEIEAKHDAMQFTQEFEGITIDVGPLADAERAVSELNRRVSLESRTNELKVQFSDGSEGLDLDQVPDRDVLREAGEFLGKPDGNGRAAEKEL